jgi:hypothetical protein
MSLKKVVLAAGAFALVAAVHMQTAASAQDCIDIVVWATDPATGICYQFPNPCSVPPGWKTSYQPCAEES